MLCRAAMRPRGPPMTTRSCSSAASTLLRTPRAARTAPARSSAPAGTRTFLRPPRNDSNILESLDVSRIARDRYNYERRRRIFLYCGAVSGFVATCVTAWKIKVLLDNPIQADATGTTASSIDQARKAGKVGKVIVHDKDGREIVPTGNSTVPEFPRTLVLGDLDGLDGKKVKDAAPVSSHTIFVPNGTAEDEYTLVGLGTRTVSFLGIQVYVVGFYIATADIAALQNRLVKRVNPIATALVSSEKDSLRASLLDPVEGEALWDAMLADGVPARSLFRIIPVRDTDFPHLRDGLVRAIQAKAPRILEQEAAKGVSSAAPDFGESVKEFRRAFNRGKAPKKQELLLVRDADGSLRVVFDDGRSTGRQVLGSVADERVSRALWLNYLGGRKVASEETRKSIVDGVIEFVERPIGTVAAQVV